MSKLIVKDGYYRKWIEDLCARFDKSRIRAFVKVNDELLRFYWSVGEDIVKKEAEARWGESVIAVKSQDLLDRLPGTGGSSTTNLGYMKRLFLLYSQPDKYYPQLVGNCEYEKSKELIFLHSMGTSSLSD